MNNRNLLLETSVKNLNSPKSYNKFLSQFPIGDPNKIKLGTMMAYSYDFYKDYPQEVIKYFDLKPLTIFTTHWKSRSLIGGINIHFFPVLLRANFINKIRLRNPQKFKKDGVNPVNVSFSILKSMFFKSQFSFRWYRPEAIYQARIIPNKFWSDASQYQINSFYKVNINQIVDRYKGWENKPSSNNNKSSLKESLGYDFESFQPNSQSNIHTLQEHLQNPFPIF